VWFEIGHWRDEFADLNGVTRNTTANRGFANLVEGAVFGGGAEGTGYQTGLTQTDFVSAATQVEGGSATCICAGIEAEAFVTLLAVSAAYTVAECVKARGRVGRSVTACGIWARITRAALVGARGSVSDAAIAQIIGILMGAGAIVFATATRVDQQK